MEDFLKQNRIIRTDRLVELLAAENKLMALEDGGVLQWEGYLPSLLLYHLNDPYSRGIWSLLPDEILEDVVNLKGTYNIIKE